MSENNANSPEAKVREIRRRTRRKYSSEEKIRIVLDGLKGEESMNRPGIAGDSPTQVGWSHGKSKSVFNGST